MKRDREGQPVPLAYKFPGITHVLRDQTFRFCARLPDLETDLVNAMVHTVLGEESVRVLSLFGYETTEARDETVGLNALYCTAGSPLLIGVRLKTPTGILLTSLRCAHVNPPAKEKRRTWYCARGKSSGTPWY